jgi:hypothetical protein
MDGIARTTMLSTPFTFKGASYSNLKDTIALTGVEFGVVKGMGSLVEFFSDGDPGSVSITTFPIESNQLNPNLFTGHTHMAAVSAFTVQDIGQADRSMLPSYVLLPTGILLRYDPVSKTMNLNVP